MSPLLSWFPGHVYLYGRSEAAETISSAMRGALCEQFSDLDDMSGDPIAGERARRQSLVDMLDTESTELRSEIISLLADDFIQTSLKHRDYHDLERDVSAAFHHIAERCEEAAFIFATSCTSYRLYECTQVLFSNAKSTAANGRTPAARGAALRFLGAREWEKRTFGMLFSDLCDEIYPLVQQQLRSDASIERTAAIDCWLSICSNFGKYFDLDDFRLVTATLRDCSAAIYERKQAFEAISYVVPLWWHHSFHTDASHKENQSSIFDVLDDSISSLADSLSIVATAGCCDSTASSLLHDLAEILDHQIKFHVDTSDPQVCRRVEETQTGLSKIFLAHYADYSEKESRDRDSRCHNHRRCPFRSMIQNLLKYEILQSVFPDQQLDVLFDEIEPDKKVYYHTRSSGWIVD